MKNIGFLLLALTLTTQAFAQENTHNDSTSSPASTLWLKGGLGFSKTSGDGETNVDSRTGLFLGAEIETPINPMFSFQYGVDYVQKGFTSASAPTVTAVENYFEIPLLLRLNFPVGPVSLSALAGGYGAWAAARTAKVDGVDQTADISDSVKAWDLGLRFGLEGSIALTDRLSVMAGVDYDLGLLNVDSNSPGDGDTAHNRSWIANVGLGFKI